MSDEAASRKRRSIAILQREGVPFIEHLPMIEDSTSAARRSPQEVALRAIALGIVAEYALRGDHHFARDLVERFSIRPSLSPAERMFIDEAQPTRAARAEYSWRYESFAVLMWALQHLEGLARPDKPAEVEALIGILATQGRDRFVGEARLRPLEEMLDQADLVYRYAWAVRQAQLTGRPAPAALAPAAVLERHRALGWLVGGEDWDEVSTDT